MKYRALLFAAPFLIGATQTIQLKPVGGWQLDYADNSCRLGREFGEPQHLSTLVLEQTSPGSSMSMVVISDSLGPMFDARDITTRFVGSDELVFDGGMASKAARSTQPAVMWSHVGFSVPEFPIPKDASEKELRRWREAAEARSQEPIDLAKRDRQRVEALNRARSVTAIEITPRRQRTVTLETGSMGKPFAMMADCTRDLVKSWGLDPDVQDRIVKPPRKASQPISWFSTADYPRAALQRGEQSVVVARVLVDATGKITDCRSLSHFDAPEFQKTVCDVVMRRGQFLPAELADGTKVPSYETVTIRFVLPQ